MNTWKVQALSQFLKMTLSSSKNPLQICKDAKALELKAGVVEGTVYDVAGLTELSKVPSREELLSKLLGSLQSPITNLARVLNQIAEQGGEAAPAEEAAEEAPTEE